jgi:uncharacterized protein YjhX (UPF0386 family)
MRLVQFINEERDSSTGLGADGMSKQKLKTLIYKETKKCTHNKLYNDTGWNGPNCIWDVFNKLNLNWHIVKSEYKNNKDDVKMGIKMPTRKEWHFEIQWDGPKGRNMKTGGYLTAAGAGSTTDPLGKYDLVLIIY